jgi:hypothetical protein
MLNVPRQMDVEHRLPVGVGELPDDAIAQDAPALLTTTSVSSAITPSNSVATAARATTVRPVKSKVMLTRVRRSARRWGIRDLARSTSERNQIARKRSSSLIVR